MKKRHVLVQAVPELAKVVGRIMLCYLAVGDPAFIMMQGCYKVIAVAMGVPPDAP